MTTPDARAVVGSVQLTEEDLAAPIRETNPLVRLRWVMLVSASSLVAMMIWTSRGISWAQLLGASASAIDSAWGWPPTSRRPPASSARPASRAIPRPASS